MCDKNLKNKIWFQMFFLNFFISGKKDIKLINSTCLTKLMFIFSFRRKCLKIIDLNLKKRIKTIRNNSKFVNLYCEKEIIF